MCLTDLLGIAFPIFCLIDEEIGEKTHKCTTITIIEINKRVTNTGQYGKIIFMFYSSNVSISGDSGTLSPAYISYRSLFKIAS